MNWSIEEFKKALHNYEANRQGFGLSVTVGHYDSGALKAVITAEKEEMFRPYEKQLSAFAEKIMTEAQLYLIEILLVSEDHELVSEYLDRFRDDMIRLCLESGHDAFFEMATDHLLEMLIAESRIRAAVIDGGILQFPKGKPKI